MAHAPHVASAGTKAVVLGHEKRVKEVRSTVRSSPALAHGATATPTASILLLFSPT